MSPGTAGQPTARFDSTRPLQAQAGGDASRDCAEIPPLVVRSCLQLTAARKGKVNFP